MSANVAQSIILQIEVISISYPLSMETNQGFCLVVFFFFFFQIFPRQCQHRSHSYSLSSHRCGVWREIGREEGRDTSSFLLFFSVSHPSSLWIKIPWIHFETCLEYGAIDYFSFSLLRLGLQANASFSCSLSLYPHTPPLALFLSHTCTRTLMPVCARFNVMQWPVRKLIYGCASCWKGCVCLKWKKMYCIVCVCKERNAESQI